MKRLLFLALLLGACNAAAPLAAEPTSGGAPATASPAPSVDLTATAAAAYLTAVKAFNQSNADSLKNCETATFKAQHKCMVMSYQAVEIFEKAIRAIAFPPAAEADARALLKAEATIDTWYRDAAAAKTLAGIRTWFDRLHKAELTAQAASNIMRGDLGLPPVPISK